MTHPLALVLIVMGFIPATIICITSLLTAIIYRDDGTKDEYLRRMRVELYRFAGWTGGIALLSLGAAYFISGKII